MSQKIIFFQSYHHNIKDTLNYLAKEYDVTLLTGKKSDGAPKNIQTKLLPYKSIRLNTGYAFYDSQDYLDDFKSAQVVIIKNFFEPKSIQAAFTCKKNNIPFIMLIQKQPSLGVFRNILFYFLRCFVYGKKTKLIVLTRESYVELNKQFPLLRYVPSSIDVNKKIHEFKKDGGLKLLLVSKFMKRKRIGDVLDALVSIKKKNISFTLRIVAPHTKTYDAHKKVIEDKIKHLDLSSHVQIVLNEPIGKMAKHYAWADIFLFPAISEPLGYSLVEAMASGVPVISSSDVGASSYVVPNKTGYVYEARNTKDLEKYLMKFIRNDKKDVEKLRMFSKNALVQISKHHHPKEFKNAMKELLIT